MTFQDARHLARMSREEVSSYLRLSIRTINRYERNNKAPKAVIECLMMIGGQFPTFSLKNDFTGWSFGSGFLYSPEGDKFTQGDIRANKLESNEYRRICRMKKRKKKPTAKIYYFPQKTKASQIEN